MTAETYEIVKGELLALNAKHSQKYMLIKLRSFLVQFFVVFFTVAASWAVTWFVYSNSITPSIDSNGIAQFSLQDRIATSSLLATFGSSVIAVFTLFTSSALTRFQENSSILARELSQNELDETAWHRWPFIPRVNKQRIRGENHYFGINNAEVHFRANTFFKTFPLPTTEADFKETSALINFLRLKLFRKEYLSQLIALDLIVEYPAWDCVTDIYRSILRYRLCYFCVWIGVCFVLQSIVFTFSYPWFYSIGSQIIGN